MGTRSLTYVYDEYTFEPILCLYRQYDGYPSGHGQELRQFLAPFTVVNGYTDSYARNVANGMGCLAAQMVAHFKKGIGQFYIMSPSGEHVGIDYVYHVQAHPDGLHLTYEFQGITHELSLVSEGTHL